jgi:NAD-dependent SIR2 family protein deacetylase
MGNGASAAVAAAASAMSEAEIKSAVAGLPSDATPKLRDAVGSLGQPAEDRGNNILDSMYWRERGRHHVAMDSAPEAIEAAAAVILEADALLFITGAGMGVDMGLSDFRSSAAFWEQLAHPEIHSYEDSSDSAWFEKDPKLAWGINYHQLDAYRKATPHNGYGALLRLAQSKGVDHHFCWTSNVDGVFQRAGFSYERVREVHGCIHRLQCTRGRKCKGADGKVTEPWEQEVKLELTNEYRCSDALPLPTCPACGSLARPNLWFCTDHGNYLPWNRLIKVGEAYPEWLDHMEAQSKKVVVIECGAGLVIPSARCEAEDEAERFGTTLVRINPTDHMVPTTAAPVGIGLPLGSAAALSKIWKRVEKLRERCRS